MLEKVHPNIASCASPFEGGEEYIHVQKILANKKSEDITQCNNAFDSPAPRFNTNYSPDT
jgi:hypothetical protein